MRKDTDKDIVAVNKEQQQALTKDCQCLEWGRECVDTVGILGCNPMHVQLLSSYYVIKVRFVIKHS